MNSHAFQVVYTSNNQSLGPKVIGVDIYEWIIWAIFEPQNFITLFAQCFDWPWRSLFHANTILEINFIHNRLTIQACLSSGFLFSGLKHSMKFCVLKDCPDYSFVNSHVEQHVHVPYHKSNQHKFFQDIHGMVINLAVRMCTLCRYIIYNIIILKMTEAFSYLRMLVTFLISSW